jgi:toxin ParE1/3/4
MNVEYSRRALADLEQIATHYRQSDNPEVAAAVGQRIGAVVARVARLPKSARRVAQREGVHIVPLIRYPYKIFYKVLPDQDAVRILRVRHDARRPLQWE